MYYTIVLLWNVEIAMIIWQLPARDQFEKLCDRQMKQEIPASSSHLGGWFYRRMIELLLFVVSLTQV